MAYSKTDYKILQGVITSRDLRIAELRKENASLKRKLRKSERYVMTLLRRD